MQDSVPLTKRSEAEVAKPRGVGLIALIGVAPKALHPIIVINRNPSAISSHIDGHIFRLFYYVL